MTSRRQRGMGMVEYIILVGLLALLLVPAVGVFSGRLGSSYKAAGDTLTKRVRDGIPAGGEDGRGGGRDNRGPDADVRPGGGGGRRGGGGGGNIPVIEPEDRRR